jgi:hypothetical protein
MGDAFDRAVRREEMERSARRGAKVWRTFFVHLHLYLVVNLALAGVWAVEAILDDGHPLWFLHVLWGWGVGLAVHYLVLAESSRRWWPQRGLPRAGD